MFSALVRKPMNLAAASCFSLLEREQMATPAPPVGQTGFSTAGPPGRNPTPTSTLLPTAFWTPTSEPVEPMVAEQAPAAMSSVDSLEETPAHFSLRTASRTTVRALMDSSESQMMSKESFLDQPPRYPHRMFCRVQPA